MTQKRGKWGILIPPKVSGGETNLQDEAGGGTGIRDLSPGLFVCLQGRRNTQGGEFLVLET